MPQDATIEYYNSCAEEYAAQTQSIEFTDVQDRFLALLPKGAQVLDFGCGSGRDSRYFLSKGLQVDACDGSAEFCRLASKFAGIPVRQMLFEELDAAEIYDGIWACSSILHVPKAQLGDIFIKMLRALRPGGILYTSFKNEDFEGVRNGRYFSCFTEPELRTFLTRFPGLEIIELWQSADVRPGRDSELWLNILMQKDD